MQAPTDSTLGGSREFLERSAYLSLLAESLAAVTNGSHGRLILVSGEAGVGKTVLLRHFCEQERGSARVLWGSCDALFTPRPLGPFLDIAQITGGELAELVASEAKPHEVTMELTRELKRRAPTIVVLDDIHWADEATLDVLRLLGGRLEPVPALVVASYRDDELDRTHPLQIVLGELATAEAIGRIKVAPLSRDAVAKLAEPYGVDAHKLHRKTAGNPFFVTEALAAGEDEIPHTVRDAVLARTAHLSSAARTLLEAVAVVLWHAELWLLEALASEAVGRLEECAGSGVLRLEPQGAGFRHELARLAVEESLTPQRRVTLHTRALAALAAPPAGEPDLARLAHHAEAAGDAEAVVRFAPAAAGRAASLGAHREAAAQYARAIRYAESLSQRARAELLERYAYECYLTGRFDEALEAQQTGCGLRRRIGEPLGEGDSLRALSRLLRFVGRTAEAARAGDAAVALLEPLGAGHELAMAYANLSHIAINAWDVDETLLWGTRALELAEHIADVEAIVYALTNIGAGEFLAGREQGLHKLERSLELARGAELDEHAGRALLNLVFWPLRGHAYPLADRYLAVGLEYCGERGLDLWRLFLIACRARIELDRGYWADAGESAAFALRDPRTWSVPRVTALVVLGLVRARRGDPEVWPLLEDALALAEPTGELQRIAPAAAARAEAAWLAGDHAAVASATESALELSQRRQAAWVTGELAVWRRRAGIEEEIPPHVAKPYALQLTGSWARAAQLWEDLGCPYEAALARADADDDDALRRALVDLHHLGAHPAAAIVARRLRRRGVRGLPRGPRPATRENPANLTPRETEVLELVVQGLQNAEIAERLFLSERTVHSHVSAILRKLGVRTRVQAGAEARRLGLASHDR
jgi:DNA-binding CsgD family transcriptional regulator/tetratricopeptide (TPR) repeat protein